MDGLKDYQISVYVANLGKYVEGVLQGAWITLPMPAERLQDTLKTEVGLGGRYEEYAIHDYDGGEGLLATVANPVEYESLTDLNLMCRAFESREDDELRRARQTASNYRYAKSWLALALPVAYCLLDAAGTFADSLVLRSLDPDSANCAYELTFLFAAVVCFCSLF